MKNKKKEICNSHLQQEKKNAIHLSLCCANAICWLTIRFLLYEELFERLLFKENKEQVNGKKYCDYSCKRVMCGVRIDFIAIPRYSLK